jgi:hypothetical protein
MSKQEIAIIIDVETCGQFGKSLVYDLGIAAVVRATGEIIESHSLVLSEVFYGMSDKMQSAYYADKLPQYHEGIKSGAWRVVTFWEMWRLVKKMSERYNVKRAYAYNAGFDRDALNYTAKILTNGKMRSFIPRSVKWCDIMHLACHNIMSQRGYRKFATDNGFVTDKGNLKTSAEACFAYITKNPHFEEEHTGLADVLIEARILAHCLRQKKAVREEIISGAWRIPQKAAYQPTLL